MDQALSYADILKKTLQEAVVNQPRLQGSMSPLRWVEML